MEKDKYTMQKGEKQIKLPNEPHASNVYDRSETLEQRQKRIQLWEVEHKDVM